MLHIGDRVLVRADIDTDENEVIWKYAGQTFSILGIAIKEDHLVYVLDEEAELIADEADLYRVVA